MPQGIIKLYDSAGNERYIVCAEVPPADGAMGKLVIDGVCRKIHEEPGKPPYEYLSIPRADVAALSGVPPDAVLKIELQDDLKEDNMVLPYNGGSPGTEVTIKLKK